MSEKQRTLPAPPVNDENRAFWEAANQGRYLVKKCRACGEAHYYPRAICPFCQSTDTEWAEGSGRGTVYTYSVMRRAPVPYAIAYVTLAEGPTVMTNLVDCDFDAIRIGQAVEVTFRKADNGQEIPMFKPAH
jgi:hypothetical protein